MPRTINGWRVPWLTWLGSIVCILLREHSPGEPRVWQVAGRSFRVVRCRRCRTVLEQKRFRGKFPVRRSA